MLCPKTCKNSFYSTVLVGFSVLSQFEIKFSKVHSYCFIFVFLYHLVQNNNNCADQHLKRWRFFFKFKFKTDGNDETDEFDVNTYSNIANVAFKCTLAWKRAYIACNGYKITVFEVLRLISSQLLSCLIFSLFRAYFRLFTLIHPYSDFSLPIPCSYQHRKALTSDPKNDVFPPSFYTQKTLTASKNFVLITFVPSLIFICIHCSITIFSLEIELHKVSVVLSLPSSRCYHFQPPSHTFHIFFVFISLF